MLFGNGAQPKIGGDNVTPDHLATCKHNCLRLCLSKQEGAYSSRQTIRKPVKALCKAAMPLPLCMYTALLDIAELVGPM